MVRPLRAGGRLSRSPTRSQRGRRHRRRPATVDLDVDGLMTVTVAAPARGRAAGGRVSCQPRLAATGPGSLSPSPYSDLAKSRLQMRSVRVTFTDCPRRNFRLPVHHQSTDIATRLRAWPPPWRTVSDLKKKTTLWEPIDLRQCTRGQIEMLHVHVCQQL